MEHLDDGGGDACGDEGGCDAFCWFGGLRGGFEEDGVSCEDGGEDGIDRDEVREALGGLGFRMRLRIKLQEVCETYFHGAMIKTTPRGVRLMYRLKPGLSVSARDTSDKDDSAMESRYSARSTKPRTSPAP